jgi:hypothetical protein
MLCKIKLKIKVNYMKTNSIISTWKKNEFSSKNDQPVIDSELFSKVNGGRANGYIFTVSAECSASDGERTSSSCAYLKGYLDSAVKVFNLFF